MVSIFERGIIRRCQRGNVKLPQIYFKVCVPNLKHTHKGEQEEFAFKRERERECCKYIYINI